MKKRSNTITIIVTIILIFMFIFSTIISVKYVNKITINNQDAGDLPVTVYAFV